MQTRRERVRQAAIDEIKSIAWETANSDGLEQVTVNGIARQMGMTPPAFYSYFKNRDDLLRILVVDAYRSFRIALATARDSTPESDPAGRLYRVFIAYREWAIVNPSMFGLFAGRPVAGFENRDPEVLAEAEQVNDLFLNLFDAVWQKGIIKKPETRIDLPEGYANEIKRNCSQRQLSLPKEVFNLFFKYTLLIHGMISMEVSGRYADLRADQNTFYQFQILDIMNDLGIDFSPGPDSKS